MNTPQPTPALRLVAAGAEAHLDADAGWLGWLIARVDAGWRPGEWDHGSWLFTGDLDSDRTAAWRCRTLGCPTTAHRFGGRCDACRRAWSASGVPEEVFDRQPRSRRARPIARGACSVAGCHGELHSRGLCFRHERSWRRVGGSVAEFTGQARPLDRLESCQVAGCGRERVSGRGLCLFHDNRLRRERRLGSMTAADVAAWTAGEIPRLGAHQFSLAAVDETVRYELLYALQRRDETPPPLDPTQVRILISRLVDVGSVRSADPEAICESGGVQYNSAARGLFRDLRRHLDRAWVAHTGVDPYAADVWEVALLDLQSNGSRRWPATQGVVDFGVVELDWLREVLKAWARDTRPYLQRLREALRACRVASQTLVAGGRTDPASLGAGDFTQIAGVIAGQRRADGSLHSASHRNLLLFSFCEVIEHGRTDGLMMQVPDPFRPTTRRHRVVEDPNEDEVGKALPESVIRQLDANIALLGPRGRAGSISPADLQAMHQTIYRDPARHRTTTGRGRQPQGRLH